MQAFHGKQEIKDFYLARVRAHQKADEIVKGIYWENGKGCAVGCTIHSSNHADYEEKIGVSQLLAHLEDSIFEILPNELAKGWPEKFLDAIEVGADLSEVWPQFAVWLLTDKKYGVIQFALTKEQKKIIQLVADYYKDYKNITKEQWRKVTVSAFASASAVASASASAAAFAADVASSAADAFAFASAAAFASASASAAFSCAAVFSVYKENSTIAQSEKILELLKECKPKELNNER